ncbi:hypothetical protein ACIRST_04360 [Kitasatospora sp. NPDC101447]|uniref:hypothetical protein n=1 Tax=Kitasatospora sp. NPDC101447 TaxID=3364102 RepID=UPI003822F4EE
MPGKIVVRAAVAGAAVLVSVVGAFAVGVGGPVRHGSPAGSTAPAGSTVPAAQLCGGPDDDVQCLASKVAWNGTGLVVAPTVTPTVTPTVAPTVTPKP